jgi:hypothetical protein
MNALAAPQSVKMITRTKTKANCLPNFNNSYTLRALAVRRLIRHLVMWVIREKNRCRKTTTRKNARKRYQITKNGLEFMCRMFTFSLLSPNFHYIPLLR